MSKRSNVGPLSPPTTPPPMRLSLTGGGVPLNCDYFIEITGLENVDPSVSKETKVSLELVQTWPSFDGSTDHIPQQIGSTDKLPLLHCHAQAKDVERSIILLHATPGKDTPSCTIPIPLAAFYGDKVSAAKLWLALPEPRERLSMWTGETAIAEFQYIF